MKDFKAGDAIITADKLWENYEYFIKAVIPEAEKIEDVTEVEGR